MSKIAIVSKSDFSLASSYDADAPMQANYGGPWGRPSEFAHVVIPDGENIHAITFSDDEAGGVAQSYNSGLAATLAAQAALVAGQALVSGLIDFGNNLLIRFAAENIAMGITADGLTRQVRTNMMDLQSAISTGSLIDALEDIRDFDTTKFDTKYITSARLITYGNMIRAAVGKAVVTTLADMAT